MPKVMTNKKKPSSPIILSTAQERKNSLSYMLKWHTILQIFLSQSSYLVPVIGDREQWLNVSGEDHILVIVNQANRCALINSPISTTTNHFTVKCHSLET